MLQPLNIAVKCLPWSNRVITLRHKITLKCVTATSAGQKVGQIQWRSTFKRRQLASGAPFGMKLTQDIDEKHDEKHHLGIRLV